MTWKAGMVGWTKAGVGMETCPVFIGTTEEVSGDSGAVGTGIEQFAVMCGGRRFGRVRGFEWVRAKVEAVGEGAKASQMVNGKR